MRQLFIIDCSTGHFPTAIPEVITIYDDDQYAGLFADDFMTDAVIGETLAGSSPSTLEALSLQLDQYTSDRR